MANHNMKVRAGFSVITGAPNANGGGSSAPQVFTAGQTVVLSDAQILSHLHALDSSDVDSQTKLASLLGSIWKPQDNVY